ncbi:MAG: polyprenyl synthetase family protein [Bacillota bacterium]
MLVQILSPIQTYLEKTRNILIKTCATKAGDLNRLARLEFPTAEFTLRPALVILSAGMFGPVTQQIIYLAAMFQFVYIASVLHKDISEDGVSGKGSKNPSHGSPFPILAGDYFYSKSFFLLYEAGLLKYLRALSETISQLNEASILKLKSPDNLQVLENYVQKDTAGFFALGCKISAEVTGAAEQEIKTLTRYGFNLGMAAGLRKENIYPEKAAARLHEAKKLLQTLPAGTARDTLAKLVEYFRGCAD